MWIPVLKGGAALLAAPDNQSSLLASPKWAQGLMPWSPPLICNYSLFRRLDHRRQRRLSIYNQEAPQLARITSWAKPDPWPAARAEARCGGAEYIKQVGLLCYVLMLFRHVMHAATVGRDRSGASMVCAHTFFCHAINAATGRS